MLLCGASTRQPDSYSWGNDYFAFIKYVFLCFLHGSSTWNQCKFSVWAVLCVPNVMVDGGALYSLAASFCFHVPWAGCGQDLMCRTAVRAIKVPIWHERPVRQQKERLNHSHGRFWDLARAAAWRKTSWIFRWITCPATFFAVVHPWISSNCLSLANSHRFTSFRR
jgi:hypothetical protein